MCSGRVRWLKHWRLWRGWQGLDVSTVSHELGSMASLCNFSCCAILSRSRLPHRAAGRIKGYTQSIKHQGAGQSWRSMITPPLLPNLLKTLFAITYRLWKYPSQGELLWGKASRIPSERTGVYLPSLWSPSSMTGLPSDVWTVDSF